MVSVRKPTAPVPPPRQTTAIVHASAQAQQWLLYYWQKLQLPAKELACLALTQDRQEYMRWTGKRLNTMALGCYCYLPGSPGQGRKRSPSNPPPALPGFESTARLLPAGHRHLIFIEPDMQPQAIEVTVAHELIHLADRVQGAPRRHRHHGYDSIAADEAAITGYGLEALRRLLFEESARRESQRRQRRPIRYVYECPRCGKEYPRTRRYSQAVSCSACDKSYNPCYKLALRPAQ